MRILPVIDLKDGVVVRGIAGLREQYQPIESLIADDSSPANVASALVKTFNFDEVYVADLDAIAGADPDYGSLHQIARHGLRLWLDAGFCNAEQIAQFERHKTTDSIEGWIVALESIDSPSALKSVFDAISDKQRAVFSLDLRHGKPLTTAIAWASMTAPQIAKVAVEIGFQRMIVLDLLQVGSNNGPSLHDLCSRLRATHPSVQLVSGGGIRNLEDIQQLAQSGCEIVLVASALHDGRLNAASIRSASSL